MTRESTGRGGGDFAFEALRQLSSDGCDLLTLAALAHEYLQNPIVISDKNWRTLALYPAVDIPEDGDWMQFKNDGMLSIKVVTENMKANLAGAISDSGEPFVRKDERMAYPRMYCNVVTGGHSAATVSVLEYARPFASSDRAILSALAGAVSAQLQKSEKLGFSRGLDYEKLLADMLDGNVGAPAVVNERLKDLNISLRRCLYLFVVDVRRFDSGSYSVSFFRDYVERIIGECVALVYDNDIVIFKSYNSPQKVREDLAIPALRSFLTERGANCGLSRCFEQITELRYAFHQATEAISIGTAMGLTPPFFCYDDLVLYHVARLCDGQDGLKRLCSPKLLELMDYDRRHNSAFTKTLRAYFASSRNITRTAQALNMHRNSAIYHLKKIEEILNADLSDADELLYLELSCRFLEYAGTLSPSERSGPH